VKKLENSSSSLWRILTFRPGNDPTGNLIDTFVKNISEGGNTNMIDSQSLIL